MSRNRGQRDRGTRDRGIRDKGQGGPPSLNAKRLQAAPPLARHQLACWPPKGVAAAAPQVRQVALGVGDEVEDARREHVVAQLRELGLDLTAQIGREKD